LRPLVPVQIPQTRGHAHRVAGERASRRELRLRRSWRRALLVVLGGLPTDDRDARPLLAVAVREGDEVLRREQPRSGRGPGLRRRVPWHGQRAVHDLAGRIRAYGLERGDLPAVVPGEALELPVQSPRVCGTNAHESDVCIALSRRARGRRLPADALRRTPWPGVRPRTAHAPDRIALAQPTDEVPRSARASRCCKGGAPTGRLAESRCGGGGV